MNNSAQLRDYQIDMLHRLQDLWTRLQSVMVQMPTGTGKTHLMAAVIKSLTPGPSFPSEARLPVAFPKGEGSNYQSGGVLVVAHRIELIEQISQTLDGFGVEHGLIVSGQEIDFSQRVQVASVQTLARRKEGEKFSEIINNSALGKSRKKFPEIGKNDEHYDYFFPSLVIIDEAHHALAKTYQMLWDWWPEAKFLGLTATPCRLNGKGFTDLFQFLLQSYSIGEFIEKGWLADFDYVSASPKSMTLQRIASLQKRGADGDYQTKEMAMVMDVPESVEHLYKTYRKFASGKKGIVYAIDRQHAQHIAEYYKAQGVNCCAIDCKTPADERKRLTESLTPSPSPKERGVDRPTLDVLVNVDIFSEGFDCPEVEFIQLARPTLSLSKYLQQVGRGMRISEGKDHVLILDNVGLYQTFGLPTDERDWKDFFYGRASGKGTAMRTAPVIIRDGDADEPELVNLEMVRIRRRSEKLEGLAVYMQDGKYGVMRDGQPTTQPVFEHIEKCAEGPFYAYGIYPYHIFQSRKTIIDKNGIDQGVQLYGNLELRGDFLYGLNATGDLVMWDVVGRRYYQGKQPKFEHAGWVDLIQTGNDEYELRYTRGLHIFRFRKDEVLFNQHIAIIRDKLIVRDEGYRVFTIFGYWNDKVLACGKKQYSTIPVSWNGHVGKYQDHFPLDFSFYPDFNLLRLKSVGGL